MSRDDAGRKVGKSVAVVKRRVEPPPVAAPVAPPKPQFRPLKPDELSTGRGTSLKRRAQKVTGASLAAPAVQTQVSPQSLDELKAHAAKVRSEQKLAAATAATLERTVKDKSPVDATRALNATLERLPEPTRKRVMEAAGPAIETLVEKTTALDRKGTREVVTELGRTAELLGPLGSSALTDPMARAIADGKLEQKGKAANGGVGGVFRGANRHNSERELVEAFADSKSPAVALLGDSLVGSLSRESLKSTGARADRALGFAGAVALRDASKVPDGGAWHQVSQLGKDVTSAIDGAVSRIENARQAALDKVIDKTLGLSGSIDQLEPGDTLVVAAGGEFSARLAGESRGAVEVTRNRDGTYTVAGDMQALVGLGLPGQGVKASAKGGGGGRAEFTFADAEEAEHGAKALLRQGDTGFMADHLSALELSSALAADVDNRFGLTGVWSRGGEVNAEVGSAMRIELENGRPTAIVNRMQATIDGGVEQSGIFSPSSVGAAALAKQLGVTDSVFGKLDVKGDARVTFETRVPISDASKLGDDPIERINTLLTKPTAAVAGPPQLSGRLQLAFEANGEGFEATSALEGVTPELAPDVFRKLVTGDLANAATVTGSTYHFTAGRYTNESRGWLDHELDTGAWKLSGENYIHHVDPEPFEFTYR